MFKVYFNIIIKWRCINIASKTNLPRSSTINISKDYPNILKQNYKTGFKYFDLQVDDKKLTEINIEDARRNDAKILENIKVISAERALDKWRIRLANNEIVNSRILINASGPWVNDITENVIKVPSKKTIRLVKGSHIVINKLNEYDAGFTLQNFDDRIVFVLPYKKNFSLIGTTEVEVQSPENQNIDNKEIEYLISCVNSYFNKQITKSDIIETFSGVRPLIEDFKEASKITRDYIFDINSNKNSAPLLNIFGGKLTTYRKLAENALDELKNFLPINARKPWTSLKKIK